jgi:uncharacterized Zn finger protein (UPF0148 family)
MVAFGRCKKCGGTIYHKDGRPKCILCGTEYTRKELLGDDDE